MAEITVLVPTVPDPVAGSVTTAPRGPLPERPVVTIVENGKPKARDLLAFIADEMRAAIPQLTIEVYSKASAGKPLEGDEAKVIAARSHLVITGVGD